jgi:hypothetical protein
LVSDLARKNQQARTGENSMFKQTITTMAVNSARDYLQERLKELKKLDLDKDGQSDVDQITELLMSLGESVKQSIEATDFQKLATGLEQLMSGVGLIGESVDRQKLAAACEEMGTGLRLLGKLLRLGVQELKRDEKS